MPDKEELYDQAVDLYADENYDAAIASENSGLVSFPGLAMINGTRGPSYCVFASAESIEPPG